MSYLRGTDIVSKSIEQLKENIYHPNTKEYFEEVYKSFINQNNRSAVVFLYSVVLYDLFVKIEELSEIQEDEKASGIRETIKQMQKDNPESPDWEKELIKRINDQTDLFEHGEIIDINHLKEKRNLCAHPTINSMELYNPDNYTVQSLMFNMLNAILIKPPHFTKEIVYKLVTDLDKRKLNGYSDDELKSLIKNRYLRHSGEKKQFQLYKSLWKFVFLSMGEKEKENRIINYKALKIIHSESEIDVYATIKNHQSAFHVDKNMVVNLFGYIFEFPQIFECLDETTRKELEFYIAQKESAKILAYFYESSFQSHLETIKSKYTGSEDLELNNTLRSFIIKLHKKAIEYNSHIEYLNVIIELYTKSPNYNEADLRFSGLIMEFIDEWDTEQLKNINDLANNSSQCYGRFRAKKDHRILEEKIQEKEPDYKLPENLR